MTYVLAIIALIGSFFLIKYREQVGDMLGDADWMRFFGGVYNFVFICGVLLFFWGIATLTGTTGILFRPILWMFPVSRDEAVVPF